MIPQEQRLKTQLEEAVGCIKHISTLSAGNRTIPSGEKIASLWLKDFKAKWGEK